MKFFAASALMLFSSLAVATSDQYLLKANVFIDDQLFMSPRVSTVIGMPSSIAQTSDENHRTSLSYKIIGRKNDRALVQMFLVHKDGAETITAYSSKALIIGKEISLPLTINSRPSSKTLRVSLTITN